MVVLFLCITVSTGCSGDDNVEPLTLEQLTQQISDALEQPVQQGTVSPADRQLFRSNLGRTRDQGLVPGYVTRIADSTMTFKAYPDRREVTVKVNSDTSILEGMQPAQLRDLSNGDLVLVLIAEEGSPAQMIKGLGVKAP